MISIWIFQYNGAKICEGLVNNILNITKHVRPFPVEDLKSMEGTIDGTFTSLLR